MKRSLELMISIAIAAAVTASCVTAANVKSGSGSTSPAKSAPAAKQLPKLLELGDSRCIPCQKMKPVVEKVRRDYKGKLNVQYIEITKNKDAIKKYKLTVTPTLIFFDAKGKEVARHEGVMSEKDIVKTFSDHGIML